MHRTIQNGRRALACVSAAALVAAALTVGTAEAAIPGITGTSGLSAATTFNISASEAIISQPDGNGIYSWGYGCTGTYAGGYLPANVAGQPAFAHACPLMQIPGPTMIVQEGAIVTVTLTNALPVAAGNTSILFPGMQVTATGGVPGRATSEATPGGTVTYTFTASKPGTYAYYSGSQADLQIEMGLYGALIVLPTAAVTPPGPAGTAACKKGPFSLAANAYDNVYTCYDREYLFQLSEMNLAAHQAAEAQVAACKTARVANPTAACAPIAVTTEPYRPDYFLVNGRSMPDDMDPHYFPAYVHQPYNANPHMLPGENMLIRFIGQGRIQHPFHIHGNHARVLARDGNLITAGNDAAAAVPVPILNQRLAGPVLFTLASVSGQTMDAVFNWTGKGLGWDVYGHAAGDTTHCAAANVDANGLDKTTHEWCADHGKPIPVTPPDPLVVANGQWYAGTPYLGLQSASPTPLPPTSTKLVNDGGYAYMWHSHDEREITTQNVFPGGMMTMLIIDPPGTAIDETQ